MMIESKGDGQLEAIEYHLARAVGEAPFLVGEPSEDVPGRADIGLGEMVDLRQAPIEEGIPQRGREPWLSASPQEGERLGDHEVRREERLGIPGEPGCRTSMID